MSTADQTPNREGFTYIRRNPDYEYVLAFFIVAALVQQDAIRLEENGYSWGQVRTATEIVAACLRGKIVTDHYPELPFDW